MWDLVEALQAEPCRSASLQKNKSAPLSSSDLSATFVRKTRCIEIQRCFIIKHLGMGVVYMFMSNEYEESI